MGSRGSMERNELCSLEQLVIGDLPISNFYFRSCSLLISTDLDDVFIFQCLVFEDAPNGVTAALKANMQVVMVPEDYIDDKERQRATLTLNSLLEFKPELFELPPFPK